ncbi:UNVERIFIED_ORG: hypothetical protein ABIB21_003054 [Arthrobacter sp. UYEF13]
MSDPRYRPKDMVSPANRRDFGKVQAVDWIEGRTNVEISRIAAAQLQHALAVKIMERLREKRLSIRAYAELANIGYDRMVKVLRGEAVMRLEDIADAQRLLGAIADLLFEEKPSSSQDEALPTQAAPPPLNSSGQATPQLDLQLRCFEENARLIVRWSSGPEDKRTYLLKATGESVEAHDR